MTQGALSMFLKQQKFETVKWCNENCVVHLLILQIVPCQLTCYQQCHAR